MCSHVSWKHIASKSKLSLLKSEIKDYISENVEFRDCTFSVKTVKLFLLFCRYDFTVNEIDEKVKIRINLHLRTWCDVYHDNRSIIMS